MAQFTDNPTLGKFMGDTNRAERPTDQRYAVAALLGHCESIAASGRLTEPAEQSLRLLIAETAAAFKMQVHEHELSVFEERRA